MSFLVVFASCLRITLLSFLVVLPPVRDNSDVFPGGFASCLGITLMSFLVVLPPVLGIGGTRFIPAEIAPFSFSPRGAILWAFWFLS